MNTEERVRAAIRNYGALSPQAIAVDDDAHADIATPNRLGYALGWIAASAIVGARYGETALEALPVYHPEHGWDRFLLTRRVSCALCADEPADSFGLILLGADDAPALARAKGEVILSLGALYRSDPERGQALLLEHVAAPSLPAGDHTRCAHTQATVYQALFAAIADLIVMHPGVIAGREVFIDDQQVGGAFHPLYLHTGGRSLGHVYDWLAVSHEDRTVFVRVHGGQAVYEVEQGTWRSEATALTPDEPERIAHMLRTWLRLDG